MNKFAEIDQMLEQAFVLAYFIHGDKESARRIVLGAMTKLEVATAAQNKRSYYTPHGRILSERSSSEALRSKVSFSKLHLLQRLIYIESEPYEQEKERSHGTSELHQQDLLVHYIKHLVRIGIKRNSFYVTLGLSRLLYNYSTAETMEIYNLVIQDPGRVKDDYYYRSRKGILLNEIKERFGDLIGTQRGPRGEEKLRTQNSSERFLSLVERCLSLFAPWGTTCSVPAKFDPVTDDIPALKYHGRQAEDHTEVDRIHAVLDPECHRKLISALGLDPPQKRLAVPHFLLSHDEDDHDTHRDDYFRHPPIDESDLVAIKNALAEHANRRRKAEPRLLRVMVDGDERARLDLSRARRTSFELNGTPELIEVRAHDGAGELLLASHVIGYDRIREISKPLETSVITEGNKRISINVTLTQDDKNEIVAGEVEVTYKERNPFRALTVFAKRLGLPGVRFKSWREAPVLMLILIAVVAAVIGILWFTQRRTNQVTTNIDKNNQEKTVSPVSSGSALPNPSPTQQAKNNNVAPTGPKQSSPANSNTPGASSKPPGQPETVARHPAPNETPPQPSGEEQATRNPGGEMAAASLKEVRKVFVAITGAEPLATKVRSALEENLQRSGRFILSESGNADAALKVTVTRSTTAPDNVSLSVRLVNARGEVLWPFRQQNRITRGEVSQAATKLVNNLLRDVH